MLLCCLIVTYRLLLQFGLLNHVRILNVIRCELPLCYLSSSECGSALWTLCLNVLNKPALTYKRLIPCFLSAVLCTWGVDAGEVVCLSQ